MPDKFTTSVRVMRSYDYSHFEVTLGTNEPVTLAEVDDLRKEAARLADKAVAQFKIAKFEHERRLNDARQKVYAKQDADRIRRKPEGERTVDEVAELKAFDDKVWEDNRAYNYEDDWSQDDEGDY